jgi:hypothetical protein
MSTRRCWPFTFALLEQGDSSEGSEQTRTVRTEQQSAALTIVVQRHFASQACILPLGDSEARSYSVSLFFEPLACLRLQGSV